MNYSGAAAAAFRPQFRPNRIITSSTPQKNKKWSETTTAAAVTVVVGTTIALAGAFLPRPSLALPGSRSVGCSEQKVGYEGLLDSDPRDPVALKMAFYGEMKGGRMGGAAKYAERLREVEPEEVEWRLLQALSCELVGDLGKAKMVYGEILEEMPLFIRALHGLALVLHKNDEDPAVFDLLTRALELARQEQRVVEERNIQILIAQMLVVKGDLEGGLKRFQELVNENPRDFRPFLCQGIIYSLLGKKIEADKQFEIYRSLVPDEFPQRGFLDDIVLAAKTETLDHLKKEL